MGECQSEMIGPASSSNHPQPPEKLSQHAPELPPHGAEPSRMEIGLPLHEIKRSEPALKNRRPVRTPPASRKIAGFLGPGRASAAAGGIIGRANRPQHESPASAKGMVATGRGTPRPVRFGRQSQPHHLTAAHAPATNASLNFPTPGWRQGACAQTRQLPVVCQDRNHLRGCPGRSAACILARNGFFGSIAACGSQSTPGETSGSAAGSTCSSSADGKNWQKSN